MARKNRIRVVYVTSSKFKKEENEAFIRECMIENGARIDDVFEFDIRPVPIQEILNVDLSVIGIGGGCFRIQPTEGALHSGARRAGFF